MSAPAARLACGVAPWLPWLPCLLLRLWCAMLLASAHAMRTALTGDASLPLLPCCRYDTDRQECNAPAPTLVSSARRGHAGEEVAKLLHGRLVLAREWGLLPVLCFAPKSVHVHLMSRPVLIGPTRMSLSQDGNQSPVLEWEKDHLTDAGLQPNAELQAVVSAISYFE